jgi:hypothetical protein
MYYLWLNEAQAGPYPLPEIQSMWTAGQITPQTLYWQEGNAEWQPLSNILSQIEPKKKAESALAQTAVIRPFEQTIPRKTGTGNLTRSNPAQQPAPAQKTPEKVQGTGRPTLPKWAGFLLLGLILIVIIGGLIAWLY